VVDSLASKLLLCDVYKTGSTFRLKCSVTIISKRHDQTHNLSF